MKRSFREKFIFLLSILVGAAPFAFGLIRAVQTGSDLRYLWVAIAAFLGATVVMVVGKVRSRAPNVVLALFAAAWVIAALFAGSTAFLLASTSSAAVWIVAFAFGFCCAASHALNALSRPRIP
jgi:steroid 5-alpha reductase family enzyme